MIWSSATHNGSAPHRRPATTSTSRVLQPHKLNEVMAPATVKYYSEYPANSGKYWSIPAEGDAVGWSYRKDWFEDPKEMEAFKAKYGYDLAPPKDWKQLRDIAEFFHRPDQKRYGIAIYTDNSYDGLVGRGERHLLFRRRTRRLQHLQGRRDHQLEKNVKALEASASFTVSPLLAGQSPSSSKNNQAITEKSGGDEHELLRLLPGAGQRSIKTEREGHRLLCQPGRPGGRPVCRSRRQGISIVSYSENKERR